MFAKVVIESPLPALDRVFEYSVPETLEASVKVGVRVKVTVGQSKKPLDGYIVELSKQADFDGQLSPIGEVVSAAEVLPPSSYAFLRALANRQAAPLAELLKLAIPNRSVAVEKHFLEQGEVVAPSSKPNRASGQAWLVGAVDAYDTPYRPRWVNELANRALTEVENGSVIICVPDARDTALLSEAFESAGIATIDYSSAQTPAKRYSAFLKALVADKRILVGNRNALLAPLPDLAAIIIWNESDFSHTDQGSPYLTSREIALVRQSLQGCNLTFAGFTMSTEIARLVSLDFLQLRDDSQLRPKVIYEEQGPAAETLVNKTIRAALAKGPVLVQVSAVGHSVSVYCKACSEKVLCRECSGPLWLDAGAKPICRWCNALNYGAACNNCGSRDLKQGRAGSSRSVAEFGKAFPGIRVLESTSAAGVETMPNKSALVVATPGCEPIAENGYAAVVLLDARNQIGRDSLRSVEDAVSAWANAVSLLGEGGTAVLVGLGGKLAEQFVLWQQQAIAEQQLQERAELSLPPVVRLGSITGQPEAAQRIAEVATEIGATVLGPTKVDAMNVQYIMKYAYKIGAELAMQLKVAQLKTGAGRNQRTQRNERLVRVKMDDRQVI